jgi:hypothetical protein
MGKMTKIALLLGALALPAYADPPAAGASAGSGSTPAASAKSNTLGAPADDGSSKLGAKPGVHAGASVDADSHAASANNGARDYRVDVDANASDKDSKAAAKPSAHRVKSKAKRGKARVKASAVNKPNAGTDHAVNGGINPTRDEKIGVGASVTGDDKAAASSAAGANANASDTGAKPAINTPKKGVDTGASAGTGAGAGAEIDDTAAGSNHR